LARDPRAVLRDDQRGSHGTPAQRRLAARCAAPSVDRSTARISRARRDAEGLPIRKHGRRGERAERSHPSSNRRAFAENQESVVFCLRAAVEAGELSASTTSWRPQDSSSRRFRAPSSWPRRRAVQSRSTTFCEPCSPRFSVLSKPADPVPGRCARARVRHAIPWRDCPGGRRKSTSLRSSSRLTTARTRAGRAAVGGRSSCSGSAALSTPLRLDALPIGGADASILRLDHVTDGSLPLTAIPRAARRRGRSSSRGARAPMPPSVPPPSAAA